MNKLRKASHPEVFYTTVIDEPTCAVLTNDRTTTDNTLTLKTKDTSRFSLKTRPRILTKLMPKQDKWRIKLKLLSISLTDYCHSETLNFQTSTKRLTDCATATLPRATKIAAAQLSSMTRLATIRPHPNPSCQKSKISTGAGKGSSSPAKTKGREKIKILSLKRLTRKSMSLMLWQLQKPKSNKKMVRLITVANRNKATHFWPLTLINRSNLCSTSRTQAYWQSKIKQQKRSNSSC